MIYSFACAQFHRHDIETEISQESNARVWQARNLITADKLLPARRAKHLNINIYRLRSTKIKFETKTHTAMAQRFIENAHLRLSQDLNHVINYFEL